MNLIAWSERRGQVPRRVLVAVDCDVWADPRPDFCAVHREHPNRVRITGMQDDGEPYVADLLGHIVPDAIPPTLGTLHAINPAVILLIQAVRLQLVQAHAVGIVAVLRV